MTPYTKTIYREIPIQISFSIDKGQRGNWNQPEYEPSIEDILFSDHQVLEAVCNEVYGEKSTVIDELWEKVNETKSEPF